MNPLKKIFGNRSGKYVEKSTSEALPTKLEIEELNPSEKEYIQNNLGLSSELMKELGFKQVNEIYELNDICAALQFWFENDLANHFNIDLELFSNALAVAWGNYLEKKLKMSWYVITDEFGTEIGLYHESNSMTVFPFNSIIKAFNNKDSEILKLITEKAEEVINNR